ncbi:MAG TPA: GlsB/YeaQ/YmgE family stress response membrane protein [Candidatus Saccharimonadia bacterium]
MTIIAWIILGALAGWLASIVTGTNGAINGWGNIVIGIIGAFIGGFIVQLFGGSAPSGLNLSSLITAVIGAVILIWLMRMFRRGQAV